MRISDWSSDVCSSDLYCAAKHGVIGLTRALALETARKGVTVNAVCPGYTETDIVQGAIENIVQKTGVSAEQAKATLAGRNPQDRLVQPDEVAQAVAWLCQPRSEEHTSELQYIMRHSYAVF